MGIEWNIMGYPGDFTADFIQNYVSKHCQILGKGSWDPFGRASWPCGLLFHFESQLELFKIKLLSN